MEKSSHNPSHSPGQQVVRWHGPRPNSPSSTQAASPTLTPSRASLGLLAKAKSWLSTKVAKLGRRQAQPLTGNPPHSPQSARSPRSPRSPLSIPPLAPLSPSSRAAPASPAATRTPGLRRFDARDTPDTGRARTHRAIAEQLQAGLNDTLARCNQGLEATPAERTDLSAQSFKDWHRCWRIAFQPPGGGLLDLQVEPDGSAQLRARDGGRSQALDLRPGQSPSAVAVLARHLGVDPTRVLRVCQLFTQAELAAAEIVIARQSALATAFGEGAQVNLAGGEQIGVTARFGTDSAEDRIDFDFERKGPQLRGLSVMGSEGSGDLTPLDTAQSFLRWQAQALIDVEGQARVDPASVRLNYLLVEAADGR